MSKTWSRVSSVPTHRIPPATTHTPNRSKGKGKDNGPPKSKEVMKLEALLAALKTGASVKDSKGGCFCQARVHPLSKYTPICFHCGLVICSLHSPSCLCPHCASPLASPSAREMLIKRLTNEISEVLAQEAEQRKHEEEEVQKAAGAFPPLAYPTGNPQPSVMSQPRKVISLNSQTKKVTVESYVTSHSPRTSSVKEEAQDQRVPPPPKEVDYVRGKSLGRRWQNLRDGDMLYVPLSTQVSTERSQSGRRGKKGSNRT